jgi:hypothetical protein
MLRKLNLGGALLAVLPFLTVSSTAEAVATWNRVFMATTGNDSNNCSDPATPCRTFVGAQAQTIVGGTIIAMTTGGYGQINITQPVTVTGAAGVVIFTNFPVTVNTNPYVGSVVLRGLTIDGTGQAGNGITVTAVYQLQVESCVITGWTGSTTTGNGIYFASGGNLIVKDTVVRGNSYIGIEIVGNGYFTLVSIDRCHLDGNGSGFRADTTGKSLTSATNTTANNNFDAGWICGAASTGQDVLNLEFCTGSENVGEGVVNNSNNPASATFLSNCVFANNGDYGINQMGSGTVSTRGNNTATGNASGQTFGTIGSFSGI